MSEGGPRLALLARLSESVAWDAAVRRHETDPWAYLRRKLHAAEGPLREYKNELFRGAKERLYADLSVPALPPAALESHKETFEALIPAGDYADLTFHLHPSVEAAARLEGARSVLEASRAPTLFDHETLPAERRSRAWEKRVAELGRRLDLERLAAILDRAPATEPRLARVARRLRRNLGEYLTAAHGAGHLRDELTPFMLSRLEAAVAAVLRVLDRRR